MPSLDKSDLIPSDEISYQRVETPRATGLDIKAKKDGTSSESDSLEPKLLDEVMNGGPTPFKLASLYRYATPFDKVLLGVGIVATGANGALFPLLAIVFGDVLSHFASTPVDMDKVNSAALDYLYIAVFMFITDYISYVAFYYSAERQMKILRSEALKYMLYMDISWYDENDALQLSSHLTGDTTMRIKSDWAQKVYAEAGSVEEETLGSIRTVASLNGEHKAITKFENKVFEAEKENIALHKMSSAVFALFLASIWVMYSIGLWYGGWKASKGDTTPGDVFAAFFAVMMGTGALAQISPNVTAVSKAAGAAEELFAILDTASAINAEKEGEGIIPDKCEGKIEAVNVNFTYLSRPDAQILRDYNVTIEPGQTVAFAGASGGGKSTLIALIERFYDPTSGTIYLDGRDVKTLNVKWLRSQIGMVSQEPVLFATSIFENIAMGGDNVTREEAIEACKLSNAHNFIMSLPENYDTLVGEKGVSLSGGQKQRVAIARAIVRKPNILVLDEATSALDTESEKIVQAALNNLMATTNMTTLVIAHRLSTVRSADKIVVLNEGHIVESGTHDELLKIEHGIYQKLYLIQELRSLEEHRTYRSYLSDLYDNVELYGILYLVGAAVIAIFMYMQTYCFKFIEEKTTTRLRNTNFESLCRQNVGFFDEKENATGALTADLATNATKVALLSGDSQARVFQAIFTLIAALVISFGFGSWLLSLIMLAIMPFLLFGHIARMKQMQGGGLISDDLAIPGAHASEVLSNIRTVAALGIEKRSADVFDELLEEPLQKGSKEAQINGASLGFSSFIMMATYSLIFWFGAKKVNDGSVGFTEMMRTLMAIMMSVQIVSGASSFMGDAPKAFKAGSTIFAIRDRVTPIDSFDPDGLRLPKVEGRLEFKDISFRYPTRPEINVLKHYTLTIEAGQTVAFCGPSGGGKSTIISLIERFYDPVVGEVLLDGHNIKDLNLGWLRSQIGLVGQEPTLFIGTIAENIAYGLAEQPSQQQIEEAAKMANAHDFITQFPAGYATQVGMKGEQLSGGQKQRIAIARAILKNPNVLLLDEATSALDSESEKVVQEALDKVVALKRRTTIVIAHRLSTIRRADKICVVSGGKIAEQGTHQELLQLNGIYAGLVESASM
ncbi:ATP-binding Cassette (ABC) Superfamily [Phytophthora infestans T30-4]|uniref:ATP-binding Cassette (ABC) Superfamily n=1 Tax=Phytophthora infestans (strain T30-4) TaxID=403677 RepID=D0P0I8_PHYIT|nr:ATP-binding Cassette (ABC) Superfamily [Phytophthora infestans T30-4]EEY52950.1 ATP-binding Cassette (ABC) Superfamily [Phytophthora infestans T30-4]|eukprot:XP_002896217.1 ATP-binding Cassette (ABC) Superfamily [Phytophthora infestans T30-4]